MSIPISATVSSKINVSDSKKWRQNADWNGYWPIDSELAYKETAQSGGNG